MVIPHPEFQDREVAYYCGVCPESNNLFFSKYEVWFFYDELAFEILERDNDWCSLDYSQNKFRLSKSKSYYDLDLFTFKEMSIDDIFKKLEIAMNF
jgi:hypothetical protein